MAERAPRAHAARRGQHPAGVLEGVRARQPVLHRDAHAVERDVGLPDRAHRALALDRRRLVAGRALLDEEALDLAVGLVAGPHDDDVGDRAVADPALGAVDDVLVAVAARARLQRDGVRAVLGLGQRERADLLDAGHAREPALALLLGAEQVDRAHRQARLHAEERPEAPVAAVDLHVHEPPGERAHPRAAVALDVVADQAELAEPPEQRPGRLGPLPVLVDLRQHLLVDEAPRAQEVLPLLLGELLADEEVVGGQRLAEVLVGHACRSCGQLAKT